MPTVLAISSQVVRGAVGNSAAVPALMRLGIEVWAVPTVIWSNHPGHGPPAGFAVPAQDIEAIVGNLAQSGALARCDGVLTGYFADTAQVAAAARAIDLVRAANPDAFICCDPVLGDDPGGLYIAEDVARAIRDTLAARADLITPNRFELAWLSGRRVGGLNDALAAARETGSSAVLATSLRDGEGGLIAAHITANGVHICKTRARDSAPHGVGDLVSAFFVGYRVCGKDAPEALGCAAAWIERALDTCVGCDDLNIAETLRAGDHPAPLPVTTP